MTPTSSKTSTGSARPLTGTGPSAVHPHQPLHQPQRRRRQQNAARRGELFHAGGQMRGLAHGRVVHVQVIANGAHHHLAAVEAHAHLHQQPLGAPHLLGIALHGLLHGQGGIAGPHRMVFMGQRRPKQRHDAIAHDLVDRALVAVHGRHHVFQDRIEELPGLLGVALGQQFHGAFEVGKQHGDLLALAFQGTAGGEDLLREIGWRVGRGVPMRALAALLAAGGEAASPVQTSTCPSSSIASRWPSMSSTLRSSSASSSSWNCRWRVR